MLENQFTEEVKFCNKVKCVFDLEVRRRIDLAPGN